VLSERVRLNDYNFLEGRWGWAILSLFITEHCSTV